MEGATSKIQKINCGSGKDYRQGYINIDLYDDADLKIDVLYIDKHFAENSIDEIYASGIFEHLPYVDGEMFLAKCYQIMKSGGLLVLRGMPDMEIFCRDFLRFPNKRWQLLEGFYGSQIHEGQFHKAGYTTDMLKVLFQKYNFKVSKISHYAKRTFHIELIK